MTDDETKFVSDSPYEEPPPIKFQGRRKKHNRGQRTHYPVRWGFRTEEKYLKELQREHPDLDWGRYQRAYDAKCDETNWTPCKVHRWLLSRKHLWRKWRDSLSEQQMDDAEKAYAKLENEGPADKDINWVKTHPRIFRLRQTEADMDPGPVSILTVDDILNACNGPAPTKSAVTMLQEALCNLNKFWAAILSEQKKTTSKPGTGLALDDFGMASDEEMET